MAYVDGFVIVLPTKNLSDYKKMAELGCKVWMKHGALDYKECIGEDMTPDMGDAGEGEKMRTFPSMAGAKPDETVIFSYIVYKSRAHRDEVNKKVMADPDMNPDDWKDKTMPFEMKKATTGGFEKPVIFLQTGLIHAWYANKA